MDKDQDKRKQLKKAVESAVADYVLPLSLQFYTENPYFTPYNSLKSLRPSLRELNKYSKINIAMPDDFRPFFFRCYKYSREHLFLKIIQ